MVEKKLRKLDEEEASDLIAVREHTLSVAAPSR